MLPVFTFERLYGVATTINFPMELAGARVVTATHASGDTVIMLDEGTPGNTTNGFADEGSTFSLALTAAEMSAARIVIIVDDQDGPVWDPITIIINTYGNEASQHNRRDPGVILATTIASVTSQTELVLTTGPNDNNSLLHAVVMIIDNSSPSSPPDRGFADVTVYTGSTVTIEIDEAMPFTVAADDIAIFMVTADVESASAIADAVWDEVRSGHTTDGTFGEVMTTDDLPSNFGSMAIDGDGEVTVATNNDKTGYTLSAAGIASLLTTQMTESYAGDGTAPTLAQALFHLISASLEFSISGTTITCKRIDGVTTSMTYTLDDATNPTSRTRAT